MKKLIGIVVIIFMASAAHAAPKLRGTSEALYPPGTELMQVFDGVSSIGTGTEYNTRFLPDTGIVEVVPLGNYSTFEVTIDVSIRCTAGSYYPAVSITESSSNFLEAFDVQGYKCFQPNLRSLTGGGASIDTYIVPRGN